MSKDMDDIVVGICKIVLIVICTIGLMFLRAFVFLKLWAWFVIPSFALPMLNYPKTIGLTIMIGFLSTQKTDKDGLDGIIKGLFNGLVYTLVGLGMACIVHFFM